ncbi:S-formylglutathione hydrolase [Shewanella chilikensis]|jgi:S-formylglutathione hydrolase|uniref:S-formylglutathione hydrolase n=1 Tax=Shewanella chilikensis TaxID=558541 RepID=A0A6G7LRN9_9GAMM|nr:S-formylglutathione hydrolase [Shewanella chilikensis]MCE9852596.1 S-formylglutathione hydrolase [Shewanella chilikensis]MCL1155042.1 S-formylglutathione hydrolase [Shewanella chilikensis]MCL1162577.1 S-formylglutathione hydrolase [Shewanella chilikensis]PYE57118.1 S-formylglutathione hydrolase [Shewanella chilikensis]QIJ04384.1 S-formylglutathione hydrolase [Shewanella chilikensis]
MENISNNRSFGGWHKQYRHYSSSLNCEMRFAIYLPEQANSQKVPVLYWLSGLTCTDENFMQKAGAQRLASQLGLAIVCPDTSPRGEGVADADDAAYDLGLGAGFYVNATQAPWSSHYRMYDYVVDELPALIEQHFPVSDKRAIAGHSMGGHGALMIALKNPGRYLSASAFAPISHPSQCPWGQKAFAAYLGSDREAWKAYDTVELIKSGAKGLPMRVDQGESDLFLAEQLLPQALRAAATDAGIALSFHSHPGYDHSYYFIASFIDEQLKFHASHLGL